MVFSYYCCHCCLHCRCHWLHHHFCLHLPHHQCLEYLLVHRITPWALSLSLWSFRQPTFKFWITFPRFRILRSRRHFFDFFISQWTKIKKMTNWTKHFWMVCDCFTFNFKCLQLMCRRSIMNWFWIACNFIVFSCAVVQHALAYGLIVYFIAAFAFSILMNIISKNCYADHENNGW